MNRRSESSSALFLIEFIIVVMLFALCSAVCVSAFVRADMVSRESLELNHAVIAAQSIAEVAKSGGEERFLEFYSAEKIADGEYAVKYNSAWIPVSNVPEWARSDMRPVTYIARVNFSSEDVFLTCRVSIGKAGAEIYALETVRYLGGEG